MPLISVSLEKIFLSGCITPTNIETNHQSCSVKVFTNLIPMVSLVPFPSLLYLQGKGRREILGTRLSFHYFSQKWVGDWVNILRMGAGGGGGGRFPVTGIWAYGNAALYGLAISHLNIIDKNGVTFLKGLLQWGHIIFWTFGSKELVGIGLLR